MTTLLSLLVSQSIYLPKQMLTIPVPNSVDVTNMAAPSNQMQNCCVAKKETVTGSEKVTSNGYDASSVK
jgi:hypothetical protein